MSSRAKMPENYHQKARAAKRERDVSRARSMGVRFVSRHLECPEDSDYWVQHGYWPTEEARDE